MVQTGKLFSSKLIDKLESRGIKLPKMQYNYRKMPQHFHDASADDAPHWCVVMVPDDNSETVTFMQGKETWALTEAAAMEKADELNNKLGATKTAGF